MDNNYDATLACLAAFLVDAAPAGAERDVLDIKRKLDSDAIPDYFSLEFRPTQDIGCTLYVRVEGPEGRYGNTRIEDAEGNLWYAHTVKCEVSWASWGADRLEVTQRRLALMTEVTRFACEVERAFSATFHHLSQTKPERDALAISNAKIRAINEIKRLVISHAKGMKVGDTKSVGIGPDFDMAGVGEVQVERKEGGRTFKYSASPECPGLVYFMRIDA